MGGSGLGLVGLTLHHIGAKVALTDAPAVVPHLAETMTNLNGVPVRPVNELFSDIPNANETERESPVSVVALDWEKPLPAELVDPSTLEPLSIDVLVGSDIVWLDSLVIPLVETISRLLPASKQSLNAPEQWDLTKLPPPMPYFILAHQSRTTRTTDGFFTAMRERGFIWKQLESDMLHPSFVKADRSIYIFWRK
ncbi:hypothetical protein HDU93_002330 [Gonapodya sp. JEL0774]|nr:hypothetical protein HDU93_002330 [Gonapodya sp. JEL0774]